MTKTEQPKRSGFRGTRNEDTSAATRARQRKARERRIQAAEALLIAEGYEITPPTATGS